jgi:hypothetical protein
MIREDTSDSLRHRKVRHFGDGYRMAYLQVEHIL